MTRSLPLFAAITLILACTSKTNAGYIFAGETNGVDVITHPLGYTGTGGTLTITVGIDPTSANATQMLVSGQNVVNTWNGLVPTTGNLVLGGANNIPVGFVDFESALLHELGHSLGLAHNNAATESGLVGADRNYTKATDGADNTFNLDAGGDGVIGSGDDIRGDDVNLNYFKKADNNPFTLPASGIIDSTTYSRDTADLPGSDTFAANGDRDVAALLGFPNTESVMQQGQFFDEAQRTLTAEDVAHMRYAMSGLDEIQGTADDYIISLVFNGLDAGADIVVDFDNTETGFAVSQNSGTFIGGSDHIRITSTEIYFNTFSDQWFFNDVPNDAPVPEPGTLVLSLLGLSAIGAARMRRRNDSAA